jgi:Surface lipoprotein assembly modifier
VPQPRHIFPLLLTALAMTAPGVSRAEFRIGNLPPPLLSGDISIGAEYDSNVSVEEVERSSDKSDWAVMFNVGAEVEQRLGDKTELALNYDYSRSDYSTFSEVDRQTHIVGSNIRWQLEKFDSELSGFYIHSRLDGQPFLDLYRVSPALSGFLAKKWFMRGAYVYQDKMLEDNPSRDSTSHAGEADVYFFQQGLRRYFNIGYRYKSENARTDSLDYYSHNIKLRYIQRIELFSRLCKLELSWRHEDRDYHYVDPTIEERRKDDRQRTRIDFEIPLSRKGVMQLYYGYADYDSNLERVDYDQDVGGISFVYRM